MQYNHLNIPTHWQSYWTRYPEGHTILEALIQWVSQVDSMVDNVNDWNTYLDEFVLKFDTELRDNLTSILNDWRASGFLDVVISNALQWQLDSYITTNENDKYNLSTQISTTRSDLEASKIDKNTGAVTNADLSQEVKEAMTGGSVGVVGENSVLTNNIVDGQVTRNKLSNLYSTEDAYSKNGGDLNTYTQDGQIKIQTSIEKPANLPLDFPENQDVLLHNKPYGYGNGRANIIQTIQVGADFSKRWHRLLTPASNYVGAWIRDDIATDNGTHLSGKKFLMLGDSKTGNGNLPKYVAQRTGMEVINGAVGGTRATTHTQEMYAPFSFHALATALVTGNWTAQDASVVTQNLDVLKSVDLNNIDFIHVEYSTNDMRQDVPLGEIGVSDEDTYLGALFKGYETLITAFPHLKIMFSTSIFFKDSDTVHAGNRTDIYGKTLYDFADAVIGLSNYLNVPCYDSLRNNGVNFYTHATYMRDSLHPNELGDELVGTRLGSYMLSHL